jgi:hypothetical protein
MTSSMALVSEILLTAPASTSAWPLPSTMTSKPARAAGSP